MAGVVGCICEANPFAQNGIEISLVPLNKGEKRFREDLKEFHDPAPQFQRHRSGAPDRNVKSPPIEPCQ